MKKYFTKDGNEVIVGKPLHVSIESNNELELITTSHLTDELLVYLMSRGVVSEKTVDDTPKDVEYYIEKLKNRLGFDSNTIKTMLLGFKQKCPSIAFQLLCKQVAIELDKKYDGHIVDSDELYVIDVATGEIVKYDVPADGVYSNNISLFRTRKDAEFAMSVLKEYCNACFD